MASTNLPVPSDPEQVQALLADLRKMAASATSEAEGRQVISRIAEINRSYRIARGIGIPLDPVSQAKELDRRFVERPHTRYLADRISNAVRDVERGQNRMMAVSMPPRAGKSTLISRYSPVWFLRRHPEWSIVLASYDGGLTTGWARSVRQDIEKHPDLGIALRPDGGAGANWSTVEGGGMFATSVRGSLTGHGARVMIIDDPVKDFVESHSKSSRDSLWDWWLSVAQTRLEPPYLVLVVMTRWHEDDFIGRLFSDETEGDPKDWERISLPAIADRPDDVLGRAEGTPLLSPLLEEDTDAAIKRWADVRRSVGSYTFSAMYQQRPAPAKGAIFDMGWWRFWTMNPDRATEDGRTVYLDPSSLIGGSWLDSWDCNFESSDDSKGGWVVGQRWVRNQANRYLVAQQRGKWTFTQTLAHMENWADPTLRSIGVNLVHRRYIEKKANGAAIIDVLKEKISGLVPVNPTAGKEARARAVTPEIESGNVYLPHPADPGNEWVADFLSEVRNFPHDVADDQVDSMTQALSALRDPGRGQVTVPNRQVGPGTYGQPRDLARAAMSQNRRISRGRS